MKILLPAAITQAMIGAGSSIPAVDASVGEVAWEQIGTYVVDELRVYKGGVYSCVFGHTSAEGDPKPDEPVIPARWLFKEPCNQMAPFDEYLYTKARRKQELTFVLSPGFITGFAMQGLESDSYEFAYRSQPGGQVLEHSSAALWEQAYGHHELLFGDLQRMEKWSSPLLPLRPAGELTITLRRNNPDVEAAVGWMGVGQWKTLYAPRLDKGGTQYGIEVTPKDYGYFERKTGGNYKREPGRKAKVVTGSVIIDPKQAPQVTGWLLRILGVPVAVDFSDHPQYRHYSTVGFLKGSVRADSSGIARMNFTLEGNV